MHGGGPLHRIPEVDAAAAALGSSPSSSGASSVHHDVVVMLTWMNTRRQVLQDKLILAIKLAARRGDLRDAHALKHGMGGMAPPATSTPAPAAARAIATAPSTLASFAMASHHC
jgi:hypothetical protein